jgi:asparagine synthase (glutamine-hydrolysing)
MCGLAGLLSSRRIDPELLRGMADAIAHRGPDDSGVWIDDEAGVGLGHRRLSIIDLSPLGHQPMVSNDGRWVIVYNGEIYNHAALRSELDDQRRGPGSNGFPWRGHSDTETLIECIAAWGLTKVLEKCVGMFALALWDRRERVLQLARDRFGEKPLYYGWVGGDFVFASELKAIRTLPRFDNPVDRRALRRFAARAYVPTPFTIYQRLFKLPPGCILAVAAAAAARPLDEPPLPGIGSGMISIERYWHYKDVVAAGLADPIEGEEEALERLEDVLAQAVRGQAVADVPVGAFLSGGIDSSTIVALYQKHSPHKVRTFSIGFEEVGFNEAEYARRVAGHFGVEHNERYVSVREAQEVIPALAGMYDEPFADSSQIPTHLVSRFAREQVTVALSGDAGDELFGGYNRYVQTARLWANLKRVPGPVRYLAAGAIGTLPPALWNSVVGALPGPKRPPAFGSKVRQTFRAAARSDRLETLFDALLDEWSGEGSPVLGANGSSAAAQFDMDIGGGAPDAVRMMYADAVSYLPDDILCKVDRASMAVSLETRVPFLDHRVAELAARIPLSMKVRGGKGKHILRELLYREAPRELFERPKAGFAIPVGEWIKGPLRSWAEDLLDRRRLTEDGYFDADIVHRRWREHLSGRRDATPALWAVLMFQAWRREEGVRSGAVG